MFLVHLFVVATLKKQRKNCNRTSPELDLVRNCSDEVDFRVVSIASFFGVFALCNVDPHIETQRNHKKDCKRICPKLDLVRKCFGRGCLYGSFDCNLIISFLREIVFAAFCEGNQKCNESRSYLRSSSGLIRLRHFFVCFATFKKHGQRSHTRLNPKLYQIVQIFF